jgi:glucuronate isomerase
MLFGSFHEVLPVGGLRAIGRNSESAGQFRRQRFEPIGATRRDHDLRTDRVKDASETNAETRRGTGDDCNTAVETEL